MKLQQKNTQNYPSTLAKFQVCTRFTLLGTSHSCIATSLHTSALRLHSSDILSS